MAANPISYAEETLRVHGVWDESQERLTAHADSSRRANSYRQELRELHERMADREQVVLADGRAKYQELSATAFQPVAKGLLQTDPELTAFREQERATQFRLESAEAEAKHHALGLQVLGARMTELGGLLAFYAAAKLQQTKPLNH